MKPLAITCGDPAGVGPEIIEQWLGGQNSPPNIELIGPKVWLDVLPETVSKQVVGEHDYCPVSGCPDATGARIAWGAMEIAAAGCRDGRYAGVVTGPVSKSELAGVGYPHPGQTEFFAAEWGGEPVMAFHSDHLRITLATWHVPLSEVSECLTAEAIERAVNAAAQLARADDITGPRIAVCGLNPHAGEAGLLGKEETERINPLLDQLRHDLPGLSVCLPGDTVFGRALKGEFDAVVAMYHDQGLGPLKTVDFDNAVNVTLGLPHVRTSPDHGTGFDIAGKGIASATSFGRAVALALKLIAAKSS